MENYGEDYAPRCWEDLPETEFAELLDHLAYEQHLNESVCAAFPADGEEENTLDGILNDEDVARADMQQLHTAEAELLDAMPLPGMPQSEAERRAAWLKLPIRARRVIRRLHRNLRHLPKASLVAMLRAAKAPDIYIEAAQKYRCEACDIHAPKKQTHKVAPPKPYVFNREVGLDVFEIKNVAGERYSVLNAVCLGTTFQLTWLVRQGGGTPSSLTCLKAFVQGWVAWAGWPSIITTDRGLHNRGMFSMTARRAGVYFRNAALEAPEQIGRVERRGAIVKILMRRIIHEHQIVQADDITTALAETNNAINEGSRAGGFAPTQWVLGKFPRNPGGLLDEDEYHDIGTMQAQIDGFTRNIESLHVVSLLSSTVDRELNALSCAKLHLLLENIKSVT